MTDTTADLEGLGLARIAMAAFVRHEGRDMMPAGPLPWVLAAMNDAIAAEREQHAAKLAALREAALGLRVALVDVQKTHSMCADERRRIRTALATFDRETA